VTAPARRHDARVSWLYARTLVREFRWTLILLGVAVAVGASLYAVTPHRALDGARPDAMLALYGGWMALFGEPILTPPETWYLALVDALYPLLGFALVGEGVVHLGMLMVSRRRGEKEWMRVMASTYRDHVVLCGVGRLGTRVLEQLLAQGHAVVVIEKESDSRGAAAARAAGVPVIARDMTDDESLAEAGVPHAAVIVLATNDDVANLEAALDARRMNPSIRVVLRLFDQRLAGKLSDAFGIDAAFSSSALAAPVVAGMTLGTRVLASCTIAGVPHVTAELPVESGSTLVGSTIGEIEGAHGVRVLARAGEATPPPATQRLVAGDTLVVHVPVARLAALRRAGQKS
jgi:Trk K+ transport system NAD-binding subunit